MKLQEGDRVELVSSLRAGADTGLRPGDRGVVREFIPPGAVISTGDGRRYTFENGAYLIDFSGAEMYCGITSIRKLPPDAHHEPARWEDCPWRPNRVQADIDRVIQDFRRRSGVL